MKSLLDLPQCVSSFRRGLRQTVEGLRPFRIPHIITGHCTGWRALHALADAFGDAVSQSAVGTKYTFDAEHYLSL